MATHSYLQKDYEEDFMRSKPTHYEYIRRLQRWRDRYGKYLDSRPRVQSLDGLSHYLVEFQYGKFDEIEVPGQYTEVSALLTAPNLCSHFSGEGQQPEFHSDSEVRTKIRKLSISWLLLETVDNTRS